MENTKKHSEKYQKYLASLSKETYIKILENIFTGIYVNDKNGNSIMGKRQKNLLIFQIGESGRA